MTAVTTPTTDLAAAQAAWSETETALQQALAAHNATAARLVALLIRTEFPDAKEALLEFDEWRASYSLRTADSTDDPSTWESISSIGFESEDPEVEGRMDVLDDEVRSATPREWDEQPSGTIVAFADRDRLDLCKYTGGLNRAVLNLDKMLAMASDA